MGVYECGWACVRKCVCVRVCTVAKFADIG